MFKNFFSPLVRKCRLFHHHSSFYNVFSVSVRRNFSTTTKISSVGQGNQRTKVSSPNTDFVAFKRYLEGHYTEPYGGQGKESRDHFIRLLTKTFLSVAEAQRLSHLDSSDSPKFINTAGFLYRVFAQVIQEISLFDWPVCAPYYQWITLFSSNHVVTLNNSGSDRKSPSSLLQDSNDGIEMFLEDYFCGILDQTELETRTNQIIGDLVHCMEDFLFRLVSEQDLEDKELSGKVAGLVDINSQEGWATKLFPEDWQHAWRQPFRGKSLMFLKQKLALNVNALQRGRKPSSGKITKLEMSRLIPIVQSSGTGKSRLAQEYDFSGILCNA